MELTVAIRYWRPHYIFFFLVKKPHYIFTYLQTYITYILIWFSQIFLRVTLKLRYYPKEYVQEFMAEAISFLFRNAPAEQLQEGKTMLYCLSFSIWSHLYSYVNHGLIDSPTPLYSLPICNH